MCLILACVLLICGCGSKESTGSKVSNNNSVDAVIQNEIDKSSEAATEESAKQVDDAESSDGKNKKTNTADVDIDMTEMSSDMVYATVYQLMTDPDTYVGKKIRIKGNYSPYWYDATSQYYHYAIIQDATACCSQGLEFVLADTSLTYPDDYPAEGDEIVVTGTYETYTESGDSNLYCRLSNAVLE